MGSLVVLLLLNAMASEAPVESTATPATVVFVCEHGAAKSVVAAALFNDLAARRGLAVRAVSRGITPDAELAPAAVAGLHADGLRAADEAPRRIDADDLQGAAHVISFNDLPPELSGETTIERWEVPPVSTNYAASRDAMIEKIGALLDRLSRPPG